MTLARARQIMRDEKQSRNRNFTYIHTYKIIETVDDYEVILWSKKTGKEVVIYDREDDGGYTGGHFLKNTYSWKKI